jgi:hypothetical protein
MPGRRCYTRKSNCNDLVTFLLFEPGLCQRILYPYPAKASFLQQTAVLLPGASTLDEKRKHWEEKLGSEISDELLFELDGTAAADDPPMRVYLNSGQVDEVRPASAIEMTSDRLNVIYKDQTVASYARASVWAASKSNIAPFLS